MFSNAINNKKNAINGNNIYIKEPLPEYEAQIKADATKRNLIRKTRNCVVSVLVANNEQKPQFVRVNEIEELDKLTSIKKRNVQYDDVDVRSPATKRQKNGKIRWELENKIWIKIIVLDLCWNVLSVSITQKFPSYSIGRAILSFH